MAKDGLLLEQVIQGHNGHSLSVDRETGVIRGVKVLGHKSRNGRVYEASAVRDCARLYEGVPVHFGHMTDSYGDRCGVLQECEVRDQDVYGTWKLNKGHVLYEQVMIDAEENPQVLALSHEIDRDNAKITVREGVEYITSVSKVNSVAVVTDAATNKSLFEEKQMDLSELKVNHAPLLEQYAQEVKKPLNEELDALKAKVSTLEASTQELNKKLAESETAREASDRELNTLKEEKARQGRMASICQLAKDLGAGEVSDKLMETYLKLGEEEVKDLLSALAERSDKSKSVTSETITRDNFPSLWR